MFNPSPNRHVVDMIWLVDDNGTRNQALQKAGIRTYSTTVYDSHGRAPDQSTRMSMLKFHHPSILWIRIKGRPTDNMTSRFRSSTAYLQEMIESQLQNGRHVLIEGNHFNKKAWGCPMIHTMERVLHVSTHRVCN